MQSAASPPSLPASSPCTHCPANPQSKHAESVNNHQIPRIKSNIIKYINNLDSLKKDSKFLSNPHLLAHPQLVLFLQHLQKEVARKAVVAGAVVELLPLLAAGAVAHTHGSVGWPTRLFSSDSLLLSLQLYVDTTQKSPKSQRHQNVI